jgi:hypothetical protein
MTAAWTVRDRDGRLLTEFAGTSALDVGRRIVPGRYDAFRLHVSSSYRELFERALARVLEREGWEIVRLRAQQPASRLALKGVPALANV